MSNRDGHNHRSLQITLVLVASLFSGLSFLGLDLLMRFMDPISMLAVRWTTTAVIFLVLMALGVVKIDWHSGYLKFLLLAALAEPCIYSTIEAYGIHLTSASISAVFVATVPSMTLLIGVLFLKKKAHKMNVLGIAVAFGGVMIFTLFSPTFTGSDNKIGFILMGVAVLAASLYTIFSAAASQGYSAMSVTAMMAFEASILYNVICLVRGDLIASYAMVLGDWRLIAGILFLAVGCAFGFYGCMNKLLGIMDASTAANLTEGGSTVVGVVSGALIAGNPWGWYTFVGVGVTLVGVWLSSKSLGEGD